MTLTKLHNHLGLSTLMSLSKLKMHIHDEHMEKETKTRMKRMFIQRTESARAGASSSQHLPIPEAPPIAAYSQPSDTSSVNNITTVATIRRGTVAAINVYLLIIIILRWICIVVIV